MKITIYELLGLIKDGKTPKNIIFDGNKYVFSGDDYSINNERKEWLFSESYDTRGLWLVEFINSEVEILEEEKKIPEKLDQTLNLIDVEEKGYYRCIMENIFKINEIIDYLKSKGE